MRLIIMRHAQCKGLDKSIINGWMDYPLTASGREEPKQVATEIIDLLGITNISMAYSSWLTRSYETANVFLKKLGIKLEVKRDLRLNERHYGIFEGMTKHEAMKYSQYNTLSNSADRLDNKLIEIDNNKYEKLLEEYVVKLNTKKENLQNIIPRSESIMDVENRIKSFLNEEILIPENKDKTILIVSHANPAKLIAKHLEKLTFEETGKLRFATCGIKIYDMVLTDDKYNITNVYNIDKEWKG